VNFCRSPDGSCFLTNSDDNSLRIFDLYIFLAIFFTCFRSCIILAGNSFFLFLLIWKFWCAAALVFWELFSWKKRRFFQLRTYAYSNNNPQKIQHHAVTNEGSTSGRSLICWICEHAGQVTHFKKPRKLRLQWRMKVI